MTSVGLVGCGAWGRLVLRDLVGLGAAVHVAAPSVATRQWALELGASGAVAHHDRLPEVDGYVVVTPIRITGPLTLELIDRGRPIFVEKPMAVSVAVAEELDRLAAGQVFVMDKWRYHPAVERMRRLVADGELGTVEAIRLVRWGWGRRWGVSAAWHLAPHDLAIALHLLGDLPPALWAHVPDGDGESMVGALGDVGGPLVTIDLSNCCPEHRRSVTVVGSAATAHLPDGYASAISVRRGAPGDRGATEDTVEVGSDMPLELELGSFLRHLDGGPPPMSSTAEGLAVVRRIDELERLAR